MSSCLSKMLLCTITFILSLVFIHVTNLKAHEGHGGGGGGGGGYHSGYHAGYEHGYDHGYDHGYNHGWEHHYDDHNWHYDHWHNNVYVGSAWYNPGFVYYDTSMAYPYYYDGYPYYYYHPGYYWGTGVNVNINVGG